MVVGYNPKDVPEKQVVRDEESTLEDSSGCAGASEADEDASEDEDDDMEDESSTDEAQEGFDSDEEIAHPVASKSVVRTKPPSTHLPAVQDTDLVEASTAQIQETRKRDLDILGSLLDGKETVALELDSDLEELAKAQKDEESSSESESSSSSDDEDGSSESSSSREGEEADGIDPKPAVHTTSLKAMFAPKPDEGPSFISSSPILLTSSIPQPDSPFSPISVMSSTLRWTTWTSTSPPRQPRSHR